MADWNRVYQTLPKDTKKAVNDLVDDLFRQQTGIRTAIDPRKQPQLVNQWLEIRDKVLANRQRFARWLDVATSTISNFALALPIFQSLDTEPPWIPIAVKQINQARVWGAGNNPRVVEYIRTVNANATDDEPAWCACFVNWCLQQAGVQGRNSGWVPSWEGWGRQIDGPQQGAIVLFKWSKWNSPYKFDHIAFCHRVDGKYYMLGGNQADSRVTSEPLPTWDARYYLMPPGY